MQLAGFWQRRARLLLQLYPPGSRDTPLKIGTITFGITVIAAPVGKAVYDRMREQRVADAKLSKVQHG